MYSTYLWSDQPGTIFIEAKADFWVQIQPRQETTSETSGCCVLGEGVAGLQFIFPFVRDYTVTFPSVCIQSSWSLSSHPALFFAHSFCIFTLQHSANLLNSLHSNVLKTLTQRCPSQPSSLSRSYITVSILSWSSLQLFVLATESPRSNCELSQADTCSTGWTAC